MKQLTYAEIVDATGVINVEELENIEILFTTCDSIASMERCARLKRLSSKMSSIFVSILLSNVSLFHNNIMLLYLLLAQFVIIMFTTILTLMP